MEYEMVLQLIGFLSGKILLLASSSSIHLRGLARVGDSGNKGDVESNINVRIPVANICTVRECSWFHYNLSYRTAIVNSLLVGGSSRLFLYGSVSEC